MPSMIDDLTSEMGLEAPKPAPQEYKPSSYFPLISYPENVWNLLKESGSQMYGGAQELGEGRIAKGLWDVGFGALGGAFSPVTGAVQSATYPLSEYTGIPEPALTMVGSLASGGAAARGLGKLAGRAMAGAGAAPAAGEVARNMPPLYQEPLPQAFRSAYRQPMGVERQEPVTMPEGQRLLPQFGKGQPEYRMPGPEAYATPIEESFAPGYMPGSGQAITDPARLLEKPVIPMGGLPKWRGPGMTEYSMEPYYTQRDISTELSPGMAREMYLDLASEDKRLARRDRAMAAADEAARMREAQRQAGMSEAEARSRGMLQAFAPERPGLSDLPAPSRQIAPRERIPRTAQGAAAYAEERTGVPVRRASELPERPKAPTEAEPLQGAEAAQAAREAARSARAEVEAATLAELARAVDAALTGTGKAGGLNMQQIKELTPELGNRARAKALRDYAIQNADTVEAKYHATSGNVSRLIPIPPTVQDAIKVLKRHVKEPAGWVSGKGVIDTLTFGPETMGRGYRALSHADAKRAMKYLIDSGRLKASAKDPDSGEILYWFTSVPAPKR